MEKKKKGLGLFRFGRKPQALESGARAGNPADMEEQQAVSQIIGQEALTTRDLQPGAPMPTDFKEGPKKSYQAPCFFSCVPYEYRPVDIYQYLSITIVP